MSNLPTQRALVALLETHGWAEVLRALACCARGKSALWAAGGDPATAWRWTQVSDYLRRIVDTYLPPGA
jgi:hypothetical protein